MPKLPPWPSRYSRAAEIKRLREELLAAELARLDALEQAEVAR